MFKMKDKFPEKTKKPLFNLPMILNVLNKNKLRLIN